MTAKKEEPIVGDLDGTEKQGKRFLLVFFGSMLAASVVIVALSMYSNHYGDFGDRGQWQTYNDRLAKSEFLMGVDRTELADAWIIGSSDTMPIEPATVERLFGMKTFNLGVFWGRAEDHWAWTNFLIRDLKVKPKMLLLGVEPWTFSTDQTGPPLYRQYRRRLLNAPRLAGYLPEYGSTRLSVSRLMNCFSMQNLDVLWRVSMRYKLSRPQRKPLPESKFELDGSHSTYSKRKAKPFFSAEVNEFYAGLFAGTMVAGDPDVERRRASLMQLGQVSTTEIEEYLPNGRMSEGKMKLFRETMALAQENDIPVAIVVLPVHPYFYDILVAQADHEEHLKNLLDYLHGVAEELTVIRAVVDASRIENFGGTPEAFHDRLHMTPDNSDRMLELVHEKWQAGR